MDGEDDVQIEPEHEGEVSGSDPEAKVKKLKEELAEVKKEKQEYMDGWQRAKADYVNLLKRSEEDMQGAKRLAASAAIEAMLPALDALERAKEHGDIPEGFAAIAKQFETAFERLGVQPVEAAVGIAFNPMIHEALGQDKAANQGEDDTITAVLEKGWRMGELVLRPAKVRVAHWDS